MSKRRGTPKNLVETITGTPPVEEYEEGLGEDGGKDATVNSEEQKPAHGEAGRLSEKDDDEITVVEGVSVEKAEPGGVSPQSSQSWSPEPERANFTLRLSREVSNELERLILTLRLDHDIQASRSEIAEVALALAIEDANARGARSDVAGRLSGRLRRRHDTDKPVNH